MSNRVVIQPTIFEDVPDGERTYGVRIYDNYGSLYINNWESIPRNDMDVLLKVLEDAKDNDDLLEIIDDISENERGLYIGDLWYQWKEISGFFEEGRMSFDEFNVIVKEKDSSYGFGSVYSSKDSGEKVWKAEKYQMRIDPQKTDENIYLDLERSKMCVSEFSSALEAVNDILSFWFLPPISSLPQESFDSIKDAVFAMKDNCYVVYGC